jgi:hypothetical protein
MSSKKKPEVGDLVMLNRSFKDHGRLAIITLIYSWTAREVMITFTDTCEEASTYVSSLEWLYESR